jgi:ribosomal protein L22
MTEEPKNDDVEETTAGETPAPEAEETVEETTTQAPQAEEEVSPEAAEDPGVAAPESDEEQVVPDKPKRRPRAKKATEDAAPEAEEKPKRTRAKKKATEDKPGEEAVEPAKPAKEPARRRRDERRQVPVGLTVRAQAKYVRTSARKARLVCDHIRGKDVVEARAILAFTPRGAAKPWLKLLESAVANAEHNHELVGEELRIESVHADEGPTLKRFQPRAMGRATRIRKRTSHLTITLTPKES